MIKIKNKLIKKKREKKRIKFIEKKRARNIRIKFIEKKRARNIIKIKKQYLKR